MQRSFRIILSVFLVGLLAGVGFLGCGITEPGTGTLNVYMAFDGSFEQTAGSSSPGVGGSATGGGLSRDVTVTQGDLIPPGRTPLSDLIITIDGVAAWGCSQVMDDTTGADSVLAALSEHDGSDSMDCDVFTVLADTSITLSVTGLDTELTNLLGSAVLPEGDYSHLSLSVSDAWVVTQSGDTVSTRLPGNSNRLKVNSPFSIGEGAVTDVVIVFDVHRSIVETPPGSMDFHIKPVLHHTQGWAKN